MVVFVLFLLGVSVGDFRASSEAPVLVFLFLVLDLGLCVLCLFVLLFLLDVGVPGGVFFFFVIIVFVVGDAAVAPVAGGVVYFCF